MTPVATSTPEATAAQVHAKAVDNSTSASLTAPASFASSQPPLVDLYSGSGETAISSAVKLRADIIKGISGVDTPIVPGDVDNAEDVRFKFSRTISTNILYDEAGLLIYDKLVDTPEYYLFRAELEILKTYGSEIAYRIFGHQVPETAELQGSYQTQPESDDQKQQKDQPLHRQYAPPQEDNVNEKWGDKVVGSFNGGVNGEEGLDGQRSVSHTSLVELGAGSLRKTIHLIDALKQLPRVSDGGLSVQYWALDLDKAELVRTLKDLCDQRDGKNWTVHDGKVSIGGLWSTYDQGLEFIGKGGLHFDQSKSEGRRCLLWLGSSIGNFDRRGAANFLREAQKTALRSGDTMLISIDRRNDEGEIAAAYHDAEGITTAFIMNGLKNANSILGGEVFDADKFEYYDRYNDTEGRHESYYRSLVAQTLRLPGVAEPIALEEGELIHVESSYKYNEREAMDLFDSAGLRVVQRWTDSTSHYDIWLVEKPAFAFQSSRLLTGSRQKAQMSIEDALENNGSWQYDSDGGSGSNGIGQHPVLRANFGLPTLDEWELVWKAWSTVTLGMIPKHMLHTKPIDLRHICLFYLGHIPSFLDIHLARQLECPQVNEHYCCIFERGVDPHVDDPTQCHDHSEVPTREEDWPKLEDIIAYQDKVVQRVKDTYGKIADGTITLNRRLARMLWMTQEHISLHLETLLYMLVQSPHTLPPPGFTPPDWSTLVRDWETADARQGGEAARTEVLRFKRQSLVVGHNDDDSADFELKALRPTADVDDLNEQLGDPEFGWDNEHPERRVKVGPFGITAAPISNDQYKTFLEQTGSKEYPASWISLDGGKTHHVRTVYGPVSMRVAALWPVQGSGKQLAAYAAWKGGRLPTADELRVFQDATSGPNCTDRPGTNVGFRNWHPVPPAVGRKDRDGTVLPGHNGGVWEFTSTVFASHDGFRPAALYPGYSHDFFDGLHRVVLGGSWATPTSIAGRRSFTNTYQDLYPFVFSGGRVAYD